MSYNQNIIHIHIIYIYISYPTSPPRRLSYPCSSFPTSSPPIGRPPPWSATCCVETIRRGKKEKTTGAGFHGKLLRVNIYIYYIYMNIIMNIYIYEYVYIYILRIGDCMSDYVLILGVEVKSFGDGFTRIAASAW